VKTLITALSSSPEICPKRSRWVFFAGEFVQEPGMSLVRRRMTVKAEGSGAETCVD